MLLGTLGESLLGNILAGKGAIVTSQVRGINEKDKGIELEKEWQNQRDMVEKL